MSTRLPGPCAFHIMVKPVGPRCNLACRYCFYLEKMRLYDATGQWRMDEAVLERFIRDYLAAQEMPEVPFAWQGGEPTLLGVEFFQKAVALQQQYAAGRTITNTLQTNGLLLDEAWGRFLAKEKFLVGLSVDGPAHLTDLNRKDREGRGAHDRILQGAALLTRFQVDFNILCCVHRDNALQPLEVYDHLKKTGSRFFQFIPIVERTGLHDPDLDLARPPQLRPEEVPLKPWSVGSEDYGDFLISIFRHWIRHDVGRYFIQLFDVQLGLRMGYPASLCVYGQTCGRSLALEHNGDLYACDHYVYREYRLGNLMEQPLRELLESPTQIRFGLDKRDRLPRQCRQCRFLKQCNGQCPKHRFLITAEGEPGLNYLCAGLMKFLDYANPFFDRLASLLNQHRPAALIMEMLRREEGWNPSPHDACPCGSGQKRKRCCG